MAGTLWPREAAGHHPTGGLLGDLVRIAAGRRPATSPSPRRSCRESAIGPASLRPGSADRRQETDRFRNTLVPSWGCYVLSSRPEDFDAGLVVAFEEPCHPVPSWGSTLWRTHDRQGRQAQD